MRKLNLKFILGLCLLGVAGTANAQLHPLNFADQSGVTNPTHNWYKDYVGVQLTVSSPAAIAGPLVYTTANDGNSSGDWGGTITTSLVDKELVRSSPDTLGCAPFPAVGSMTGKIAFIWRGDCEFGAKALAAEAAGAIACIIVNHSPGGPVGMGAGAVGTSVNIPVFMISLEQGTVINDRLRNNETVKVSFTTWGSGAAKDLAILPNGIATWHAFAVPQSQIGTAGTASPVPYKGYDGAFLANFGSVDATNVKLKSEVTFTPLGSSTAQPIHKDSISFSSFPVADSIVAIGMATPYDVHPPSGSTTGRFDVNYTVSSDGGDDFTPNNSASYSYHVTEDVFCKGRYDLDKGVPIANSFWRLETSEFTMGNLYYVSTGGYAAISSVFSISKENTDFLDGSSSTLLVYKWDDAMFQDSMIQVGELTPVAIATATFGPTDSNGKMYNVNYAAADGSTGISGLMLEENTWYWVVAVTPGDCFLGMDGITNHYPRTYLRHHATSQRFTEFYSSQRVGSHIEIHDDSVSNPGLTNSMFVFEGGSIVTTDAIDSARFAQQKNGFVPAISLRIGTTLGVNNIKSNTADVNLYPNPASDVLNVTVGLDEKASKVTYKVIDILGKSKVTLVHNNVKDDRFSVSTGELAAGTYFLVINADNKSTTVRKFTVVR